MGARLTVAAVTNPPTIEVINHRAPVMTMSVPPKCAGEGTHLSPRALAYNKMKELRRPSTIAMMLFKMVNNIDLPQVHLTLRLSCGARAPQRFCPRPPARRQLQPVVRWPNFPTPL